MVTLGPMREAVVEGKTPSSWFNDQRTCWDQKERLQSEETYARETTAEKETPRIRRRSSYYEDGTLRNSRPPLL